MMKKHLETLLKTTGHGIYGNNITVKNIIDGVIKLADEEREGTLVSCLNTSVNHNKLQVEQQAWRQHPELHEGIAYGVYEYGHNLTKTSIRCEHFLPYTVAVATNYNITTFPEFMESFRGMMQLYQELLGAEWGDQFQIFITEMTNNQIGARNGIPYIKALMETWRCELHRYSNRQAPFQIMGRPPVYDPRSMTTDDWMSVLRTQWQDFKDSLTVMHEFEFNQNKSTSRVIDHKPLGYKAKAPAIDPKVVRVEAKGANDKRVQAPAKAQNLPAPAKKVRPDNGRKPAQDAEVALCFGDLLNHYGASQQIACQSPCRFAHYKDLPKTIEKAVVLQKLKILAPRYAFTDETIAFMKKKISADPKFK